LSLDIAYEAIAYFEDGRVIRGFAFQPRAVAITEDGVDGLLDLIYLNDNDLEASTPELLCLRLDEWILERVRGYKQVKSAVRIKNFD